MKGSLGCACGGGVLTGWEGGKGEEDRKPGEGSWGELGSQHPSTPGLPLPSLVVEKAGTLVRARRGGALGMTKRQTLIESRCLSPDAIPASAQPE